MGREHLTIVHSSPSVLLVAVRSQTVEAIVVVAHSPVEGHERGEVRWETLSELLLTFVNDAPTNVRIDANGRLGSSTSKHVVCQQIKKHPTVSGCNVSLWVRTSVL